MKLKLKWVTAGHGKSARLCAQGPGGESYVIMRNYNSKSHWVLYRDGDYVNFAGAHSFRACKGQAEQLAGVKA